MPSSFFDPVPKAVSVDEFLTRYIAKPKELIIKQSVESLHIEAESVLKKSKQANTLSPDKIDQAILKALEILHIVAEKYLKTKQSFEAACVYQLIESQANRQLVGCEQSPPCYQAPTFK